MFPVMMIRELLSMSRVHLDPMHWQAAVASTGRDKLWADGKLPALWFCFLIWQTRGVESHVLMSIP